MEFVTCAEISNICVKEVAKNHTDRTSYDTGSVTSMDSNASRRSERIARKRIASLSDSQSQCHLSGKARRLSDVVCENKTCFPTTRRQSAVHAIENVDIDPDNASICTALSTDSGLRRSVRIANR